MTKEIRKSKILPHCPIPQEPHFSDLGHWPDCPQEPIGVYSSGRMLLHCCQLWTHSEQGQGNSCLSRAPQGPAITDHPPP